MDDGSPPPETRLEWLGRPAFFELASGLTFVGMNSDRFSKLANDFSRGHASAAGKKIFSRLAHEVTHYFQFLGCGYVAWIGSRLFKAVRQASPFPFTEASLQAWLETPKQRPAEFDGIFGDLARTGPGGLSPRELIEGAAFLSQAMHDNPDLTNGGYLILLEREQHGGFYGRLYRRLAFAFDARAMRETLFLSQLALEFIDPHLAIDRLIVARIRHGAPDDDDLAAARLKLVEEVREDDHLGSAADLAAAGLIDHPLLRDLSIYTDEPDWGEAVRNALWRKKPMLLDFLRECEILLNDAVWFAKKGENESLAERENMLWARVMIARMSLQFGTPLEDSDVRRQ